MKKHRKQIIEIYLGREDLREFQKGIKSENVTLFDFEIESGDIHEADFIQFIDRDVIKTFKNRPLGSH